MRVLCEPKGKKMEKKTKRKWIKKRKRGEKKERKKGYYYTVTIIQHKI